MKTINDILKLNLHEDIKNVIDLEDQSELEILQEIESYIVTDNLGHHLHQFLDLFCSHIKETGVWLSGFYGSGKSYFGKMLGYIIDNRTIQGTSARDRLIPRLRGVKNESLIESAIRKLSSTQNRVICLDIAKQNTSNGLAFTLFAKLLSNLGLREDVYGYMAFDHLVAREWEKFDQAIRSATSESWESVKGENRKIVKTMRAAYQEMGFSEIEFNDTKEVYENSIRTFSAESLKDQLARYSAFCPDETLVFFLDEASEAISQKKFTLLDLEGLSEALSSMQGRVWTIAIAQEKLDDVINNANVSKTQLIKVTDRFKTKIHLESHDVDIIIRARLLQKTEEAQSLLHDYYQKNEGLIANATNLKASISTKTVEAENFAIYYPFHKYQFDLLQKFLFSSKAMGATQVAARGMIITTFDVLRKQMRQDSLYHFTTGFAICTEAQTAPSLELVTKYQDAKKILQHKDSTLDGEKLLKTIHFLTESEAAPATAENITKSFICDIATYYNEKPRIEEALSLLVAEKALLFANNIYRITSDFESKLLEEMQEFDVEYYSRKRFLSSHLSQEKLFAPLARLSEGVDNFQFSITTDQDDALTVSGNKHLRLVVYSLYNIGDDRAELIETLKFNTQQAKDTITLIPCIKDYTRIDRLITDISRYTYIEEKYAKESDPQKRQTIQSMAIIREEKQRDLRNLIEAAYQNASLIYLFDEVLTQPEQFKNNIQELQRRQIKNIYTKRLSSNLSEKLIPTLFKSSKEKLSSHFSSSDFTFFDKHGNFVGDNLRVVEEIRLKLNNRYIDGRTLESELSGAPWGYSFGTISVTLAVLLLAGKLSVKYNGEIYFSHDKSSLQEAFTNTTRFKSASFKPHNNSLDAADKSCAVRYLLDMEVKGASWRMNDFELAELIQRTANDSLQALQTLESSQADFDTLFHHVIEKKEVLQNFTHKITESNYIERVENFVREHSAFNDAVCAIHQAEQFIKSKLPQVQTYKHFIHSVNAELEKSSSPNACIAEKSADFARYYSSNIIRHFSDIQECAQQVKDCYFSMIMDATEEMKRCYSPIVEKIIKSKQSIPAASEPFNAEVIQQLNSLLSDCQKRIIDQLELKFSVRCEKTNFSLADIHNYIELAEKKKQDLHHLEDKIRISITTTGEATLPTVKTQHRVQLSLRKNRMTVREYQQLLHDQLRSLDTASPDDEVILNVETY